MIRWNELDKQWVEWVYPLLLLWDGPIRGERSNDSVAVHDLLQDIRDVRRLWVWKRCARSRALFGGDNTPRVARVWVLQKQMELLRSLLDDAKEEALRGRDEHAHGHVGGEDGGAEELDDEEGKHDVPLLDREDARDIDCWMGVDNSVLPAVKTKSMVEHDTFLHCEGVDQTMDHADVVAFPMIDERGGGRRQQHWDDNAAMIVNASLIRGVRAVDTHCCCIPVVEAEANDAAAITMTKKQSETNDHRGTNLRVCHHPCTPEEYWHDRGV